MEPDPGQRDFGPNIFCEKHESYVLTAEHVEKERAPALCMR